PGLLVPADIGVGEILAGELGAAPEELGPPELTFTLGRGGAFLSVARACLLIADLVARGHELVLRQPLEELLERVPARRLEGKERVLLALLGAHVDSGLLGDQRGD